MKLTTKDIIKLIIFFSIWYYLYTNTEGKLKEIIQFIPNHAFITLGYYAIISVSYNIMFISKYKHKHSNF